MTIKQLTVFVENRQGALVEITDLFAANHVDMRALSIASAATMGRHGLRRRRLRRRIASSR